MKILIIITAFISAFVLYLIFKALRLRPTEALSAKIIPTDSDRAAEYGKKLSEMIRSETVSCRNQTDRDKFYRFHDLLEELFPLLHEKCEKHVFDGSLLYRWNCQKDGDGILLMSHHDVVEASGEWTHGPFSGHIDESGRVWGRGAVDTKASLFCILTSVEELIRDGYEPECDIYIASSCTEEWSGDGAPQTVEYLQKNGVHLKLLLDEGGMIVEDPVGGVHGIYAMVGTVEKGYGDIKFTAHSKGGHSSAPPKDTPLVRLGKFMADVEKNYPFRSVISASLEEMFSRFAPNMDFGMKLIFANMKVLRPVIAKIIPHISHTAAAMMRTTIAFTCAGGSEGANVLPTDAWVIGNMRFAGHQPNEESIKIISAVAEKYSVEAEVIVQSQPCPVVDHNSGEFRMIEDIIHEIYPGIGVCPYIMTGGTDAKSYTPVCENALRFAPLYIDPQQYASIHSTDENIFSWTLPMGVDFYKEVIKRS